jgi:hypothetical protein
MNRRVKQPLDGTRQYDLFVGCHDADRHRRRRAGNDCRIDGVPAGIDVHTEMRSPSQNARDPGARSPIPPANQAVNPQRGNNTDRFRTWQNSATASAARGRHSRATTGAHVRVSDTPSRPAAVTRSEAAARHTCRPGERMRDRIAGPVPHRNPPMGVNPSWCHQFAVVDGGQLAPLPGVRGQAAARRSFAGCSLSSPSGY